MTKIAAYTALQDAFGREQARALADFFEQTQEKPDLSELVTKADLQREMTALRQDFKQEMKDLRLDFVREIAKTCEEFLNRLLWTTFLQVLTIVGAIVAIVKFLPN